MTQQKEARTTIVDIELDNIDSAFERGLISEKERDEAIDDVIRTVNIIAKTGVAS